VRPIVYLDVDDTLLRWPEDRKYYKAHPAGGPAWRVGDVLADMRALVEVRWLTSWASSGVMSDEGIARLSRALGVDAALLTGFDNPKRWEFGNKTTGIDFDANREWFWIEDECRDDEMAVLRGRGCSDRFIRANSSEDANALWNAWGVVLARIGYPRKEVA